MKKLLLLFFPAFIWAASLYLPIDNPLMNDVDKMAVLANMSTAKKPYSLKMIKIYNEKIEVSHPKLHKKIDNEISRLTGTFAKERLVARFALSDGNRPIPNSHGKNINGSYDFHAAYLFNPSDYFQASIDLNAYEKDDELKIATNNSYVSLGWDYFQIDAGYRDHWYSPAYLSSYLSGTNAINSPSITLSNTEPFSFGNIQYEFFLSKLEYIEKGIIYSNELHSGSPILLGTHISFMPFDNIEIGLNRILQFGGGPRTTNILDAFIDPGGKDNTNDNLSQDEEGGNQQASFTLNSNWNVKNQPLSLYFEYAGEDTAGGRDNARLGNIGILQGIFLPSLTENISLRYEYSEMQSAWNVHHLYPNGLSNENNSIGHWITDMRLQNDGVGGKCDSLNIDVALNTKRSISLLFNNYRFEKYGVIEYHDATDVKIKYIVETNEIVYDIKLFAGIDPLKENFSSIHVGVYF